MSDNSKPTRNAALSFELTALTEDARPTIATIQDTLGEE